MQRFTQEDAYQDDNLQYNLYGYCSANPVMYVDPTGHKADIGGENATVKVNPSSYLGVRATPDDKKPEIGKIFNGERVHVHSDDGYFALVTYYINNNNGKKSGYVHSKYLVKDNVTPKADVYKTSTLSYTSCFSNYNLVFTVSATSKNGKWFSVASPSVTIQDLNALGDYKIISKNLSAVVSNGTITLNYSILIQSYLLSNYIIEIPTWRWTVTGNIYLYS